jgi:hypothetical protein
MPRRHRKMTGGFWESLSQSVGDAWNKSKKATTDAYSSATTTTPTSTTPTSTGYMGGRKKSKTKRHMKGGYSDNTPLTGLAATAEPITEIKSAEPNNIVGGKRKTKRRQRHSKKRERHSKSRKH